MPVGNSQEKYKPYLHLFILYAICDYGSTVWVLLNAQHLGNFRFRFSVHSEFSIPISIPPFTFAGVETGRILDVCVGLY